MKKQIVEKVLSPQLFAVCYLPFLAVNMIQLVNPMAFTRVLLAVFAVWAAAVAVRCYFFSKEIWTRKYLPILLAFLAVCLLTELINFEYGGVRVIGELCFFAVCIVLLYTQDGSGVKEYAGVLKGVAAVLGAVISVMIIVSLWMFVNMYSVQVTTRSGTALTIGFVSNRLYGLFSSPNVGGMFSLILVWCSIVTLYLRRGEKHYPLWIAAAILQMILAAGFISVALSRGTNLMGIAFVAVFMILRPAFEFERRAKLWKQYVIRIAGAAAALLICVGAVSVMNSVLLRLMEIQFNNRFHFDYSSYDPSGSETGGDPFDAMLSEEERQAAEILKNALKGFDGRVEAGREDIDITNKRLDIWKNHLQLMKGTNLLTGVNDPLIYFQKRSAEGVEFTHQQLIFIEWAKGNMHNGYLQILVNCGIVALGLMLVFLSLCVVKCFRYFIRSIASGGSGNNLRYTLFAICVPMVVCILVDNVVETNFVLMGANFFQALFWFAAGVCVLCVNNQEEVK